MIIINSQPIFSIVVPTYNCDNTIEKTINSILNQNIPKETIEIVVIDDCSTDNTENIIRRLQENNSNIYFEKLESNSGGPSRPRNVGINRSNGDFIFFLDSDDWLSSSALEYIYSHKCSLLKSDMIIGKTAKVTDKSILVYAKFMSAHNHLLKEHSSIPFLYYYLGPQSKLIKRKILTENNIMFPENIHFGEDKIFFLDVYSHIQNVSTITKDIGYVNRMNENKSLVSQIDFVTKRESDSILFKKILSLKDNKMKEKFALRLIEYDFFANCNSYVYLRLDKNMRYKVFNIIKKIMDHPYMQKNIIQRLNPNYSAAVEALKENNEEKFYEFFNWLKKAPKTVTYENNQLYYISQEPYHFKILPIRSNLVNLASSKKNILLQIKLDNLIKERINCISFESRKNYHFSFSFKNFTIENDLLTIEFPVNQLLSLKKGIYNIYVVYDGYKNLDIKYGYDLSFSLDNKEGFIYPSKNGNLSCKIL